MNLEIPTLKLESTKRAPKLNAPVVVWGSVPRSTRGVGTWIFYTDDYRFEALWSNPDRLVRQRSAAAFEVNYSVFDASPSAVAVWAVYRKRWLARYWQRAGLRVWVDLCFSHRHSSIALLGVPAGWQRYCTRAFASRIDDLDFEIRQARRRADGAPFTLAVYGGGRAAAEWCARHREAVHIPSRTALQHRPGEGSRRALMKEAAHV